MKKLIFFILIIIMISSCSSHLPSYKLVSYSNQIGDLRKLVVNVNAKKDVDIMVLGIWSNKYNIFIGYESWFPSIAYAKNSIQNGQLSGTWLDTCKNKIVIWKSDDNNFKNASIEIMNGPEEIFRIDQ